MDQLGRLLGWMMHDMLTYHTHTLREPLLFSFMQLTKIETARGKETIIACC